jgi:hypothetical protein
MIPYKLILAIIMIESGGDTKAIGDNGLAFGILQIHEAYCIDASQYAKKTWKHEDAFDSQIAIEMFKAYMARYATPSRLGRDVTAEDIARIHNGGLYGYKRSSTDAYWTKVKRKLIEFGEHDLANGKVIFEYEDKPLSRVY